MDEVDTYLENVPEAQKAELLRIRTLVRKLVPEATESISYALPTFKYKNRPLLYYAAFKDHMSLFPTPGPAEQLSEKLAGYKVSKGTIQFTLEKPLPDSLITEIIHARLAEIDK